MSRSLRVTNNLRKQLGNCSKTMDRTDNPVVECHQRQEMGHNGPPPQGAAGVDAHFEQATGNGHVAASSGPSTGSTQGYVEASAAQSVQDPVFMVARGQPLSVSGAYVRAPPPKWPICPLKVGFISIKRCAVDRLRHIK